MMMMIGLIDLEEEGIAIVRNVMNYSRKHMASYPGRF
jgi:hypothetical protein